MCKIFIGHGIQKLTAVIYCSLYESDNFEHKCFLYQRNTLIANFLLKKDLKNFGQKLKPSYTE